MAGSRTVFITGASSGFGRDTALAAANRGHRVFATMRGVDNKNAEAAASLREQAAADNLDLHVLELDVTDEALVTEAVDRAVESACGVDRVRARRAAAQSTGRGRREPGLHPGQ